MEELARLGAQRETPQSEGTNLAPQLDFAQTSEIVTPVTLPEHVEEMMPDPGHRSQDRTVDQRQSLDKQIGGVNGESAQLEDPDPESGNRTPIHTGTSTHTLDKQVTEEQNPRLWTDVITGNREPARGLTIGYTAPAIVDGDIEITIEESDVISETKFWESSLIMYVLGGDLTMNSVKQYMIKFWNFVTLPEIFYNEEGYFILKFRTVTDRDAVMSRGPYTIYNMTMFIREWTRSFCLKDDMLRTIPIWVKLPRLPLHLWGAASLSKIGSALGIPKCTDECTAHKLRISYARLLVEVDITKKLREHINIKDEKGNIFQQPVEYEWKPLFCERCQKVGHVCKPKPKVALRKQPDQHWHMVADKRPQAAAPVPMSNSRPDTSGGPVIRTPIRDITAPSTSEEGGEWLTVENSRRSNGKGKEPMSAQPTLETSFDRILCQNGFASLRDENDSGVVQDGVP